MSFISFPFIRAFHSSVYESSTITFAASDTTSNALCRILDVLARNQDAQDKLRQEIMNARSENEGGDLSHDQLVQLPYLDAICRETMRV